MSASPLDASRPDGATAAQSLNDRVLARLSAAGMIDDQRPRSRNRPPARRRSDRSARTPEAVREARSLRRVFLEMGDAYREYRGRTGAPVSPDVKAAAVHFRQDPNVASLVSVAARLDELRVLGW